MTGDPVFRGGGLAAPLVLKMSPQAKVMRLRVDTRTGQVLLTVPRRASRRRAIEWAEGKRAWIEAALARLEPHVPIRPGSVIPFRGAPHQIAWRADQGRTVQVEDGFIHLGGPEEAVETRVLRWLKAQALDALSRDTEDYARRAGVTVTRVGVADQRSRWGSCSSTGAIRYSWRLILAPDYVRQATAAHEVAHRVHMNHGPAFHALVDELFGASARPAHDWLRAHGASLHRIGTRPGR